MPHLNLTMQELGLVANCMNEALEAVDDAEFHSRVGAYRHEVERLHRSLLEILRREQAGLEAH